MAPGFPLDTVYQHTSSRESTASNCSNGRAIDGAELIVRVALAAVLTRSVAVIGVLESALYIIAYDGRIQAGVGAFAFNPNRLHIPSTEAQGIRTRNRVDRRALQEEICIVAVGRRREELALLVGRSGNGDSREEQSCESKLHFRNCLLSSLVVVDVLCE